MITIKNTYWHLYSHVVPIPYTSTDRETYTDTTRATDRDIHDTDTEFVRTCIHTVSNSMVLSAPVLVLWLWWCSSACRSQKVARSQPAESSVNIVGIFVFFLTAFSRCDAKASTT